MIKITKCEVYNMENALRGARNPLNSWDRCDSSHDEKGGFVIGPNDMLLAKKLCRAGADHRKFIRQIFISVDILAPMYWWKEFDTYKVGTVTNSTSTMHKIHAQPLTLDDFSYDHMNKDALLMFRSLVDKLELLRLEFIESKEKEIWYSIIQLLPSSYNQLRTCTFSYENALNMYSSRKSHKLDEWRTFCEWITELPYFYELFLAA